MTAGSVRYDATNVDADDSICPYEWRAPNSYQMFDLLTSYGLSYGGNGHQESSDKARRLPLSIGLLGRYDPGTEEIVNHSIGGLLWTNSAGSSNSTAMYLSITHNGWINIGPDSKLNGGQVRCYLR